LENGTICDERDIEEGEASSAWRVDYKEGFQGERSFEKCLKVE
jgi:hypothetical protein